MEANNVFLLTTGMRCDDDPDPVHLERLSIEDDAVDRVRHRPSASRRYVRSIRTSSGNFKAGQPVFLLVRPDGARYAMQSYPEKPENPLSYADLPSLGGRLKLPPGWRYETMTPATELILRAQNRAVIVQDDLDDTYRRLE